MRQFGALQRLKLPDGQSLSAGALDGAVVLGAGGEGPSGCSRRGRVGVAGEELELFAQAG